MTRKKDSLTERKPIWPVSAIAVLLLRDVAASGKNSVARARKTTKELVETWN